MGIRNTTNLIIKSVLIGGLVALVVAFVAGAVVNQRFVSVEMDKDKLKIEPKPTRIYDANGNKIAEFEKNGKEMVPYEDIPVEIVEAFIATEDRVFFEHTGVNIKAIFRAILVDIRAGSFVQGGSTITQQLVKQIYLHPGKTLDRKIQEVVYAAEIEKEYSKQDIIAYYLNHIFYGQNAHGVKSAIEVYFGQTIEEFKEQDRIDLIAKSALLAGMPNAPSVMNPYSNQEIAMVRRNTVLTNMYVEGYITREEYEAAKAKDFLVLEEPNLPENAQLQYPEYVTYVLSEASEKLDMEVAEVMYSGASIYTSFQPEVYKSMREHMSDDSLYPANPAKDEQKVQGAAVFLNPQNGEIYALTGSREEVKEFLTFNRASQAKRQPGSAFKPLIAYGPALETGEYSMYSAVSCSGNFGDYHPKDHNCGGSKSMIEALRVSNNIPAVWMLNKVGIDYATEYVAKLGIELTENDTYLPIALGGLDIGVTPLELADAYQAYANGGKRAEAHTIRRLVNHLGEIVYEPEKPEQVISEKSANQMKTMLRSVVTSGTGTNANVPGYNISGKTGTNENPSGNGNKDIWFVGFTDNMVGVVWMGFDHTDSRHYIPSGQTSYITAKMFAKIAKDTLEIIPKAEIKDKETEKISIELFRNTEGNKVTVKWEDREGLVYEIMRNENFIGDSLDGTYTDSNVEPGQSYSYQVIGYNEKSGEKVVESNVSSIQLPKIEIKEEVEEKKVEVQETTKPQPEVKKETQSTETQNNEPAKEEQKTEEVGTVNNNPATTESSTAESGTTENAGGTSTTSNNN